MTETPHLGGVQNLHLCLHLMWKTSIFNSEPHLDFFFAIWIWNIYMILQNLPVLLPDFPCHSLIASTTFPVGLSLLHPNSKHSMCLDSFPSFHSSVWQVCVCTACFCLPVFLCGFYVLCCLLKCCLPFFPPSSIAAGSGRGCCVCVMGKV